MTDDVVIDAVDAVETGFAAMLDSAGLGRYLTDPTAVFAAGDVAITLGEIPDAPDDLIVVTGRVLNLHPALNNGLLQVQFRSRSASRANAKARAAAITTRFASMPDANIGGLNCWLIEYINGGGGGWDSHTPRRFDWIDVFHVHCDWPTDFRVE